MFPVLAVGILTKLSTFMVTIVATAVLYNILLLLTNDITQENDNNLMTMNYLKKNKHSQLNI